tara:strand:- start:217 stop:675 length:459 start_codon:yes stop_codon:yes gene_type:complete
MPKQLTTRKTIMVLKLAVSECMRTSLVTFKPDTPILEAMDKFIEYGISGGPVLNDKKEVIGVISESDALKAVLKMAYHEQEMAYVVKDFMTRDVDVIHEDDNLIDVASKFIYMGRRRFPVINDDQVLVGQVSRRDILEKVRAFRQQAPRKVS